MADQQNKEIPPWEMEWGTPSSSSSLQTKEVAPWDMDWGKVASYNEPAKQITPPGFESVFERLIQAESRGAHRDASGRLTTSPVGAQGISQVMPATAKNPGYGIEPIRDDSEEEYLRFGRDYLQAMLNEFDGDYRKAVAAYNAGPASVQRAVKRAEEKGGDWIQYLPKKKETIPYMKRILGEI